MKTFIVYDLDSQSSLLLANKKARKLRDIVQARRLEFSTQIFWQKKLIWKNKLPAEPKWLELPISVTSNRVRVSAIDM